MYRSSDEFSEDELEQYSRQIVLKDIGYNGQLKLRNSRVCVIGLGGLGSQASMQLAAMGVGFLRIVDRDVVERSNLQRQLLYGVDSLYYPKAEVAAMRLNDLNPNIEIEPLTLSLNADTAKDVVEDMDVVVDGLDSIEPRYAVNWACIRKEVPYVFGAAIEVYGNISTIIPGKTPCLECFSAGLTNEMLPSCGVVGVHPSILGVVSSIMVSEGVRIVLGQKTHLSGSLLYCDLHSLAFDKIRIARRENCSTCGSEPFLTTKRRFVEEICGRGGKRTFVVNPKTNLELDIDRLSSFVEKKGILIKLKAQLGVTFNYREKIVASIMKSGVMIVEGIKDEKEVVDLYKQIIHDGLEVALSRIE